MAREVRVDTLAVECGVPVAQVMELLVELGQPRVRRVSQHISEDLARLVRQRIGGAAAATSVPSGVAHEEVALFAQAMHAAGVRPLARESKPPRSRSACPTPVAGAASAPRASSTTTAPPPLELPDPAPPILAPAASTDTAQAQTQARIAALEAQLADEASRREALEAARRRDLLELAALRDAQCHAAALAERLAEHAAVAPRQRTVLGVLQRRGLVGLDEANIGLRNLLAAHLLDSSLPFLVTPDFERLERTLDERLCLCCGRQDCGLPTGVERVTVPTSRCELCGGADLGALFRRFSDACLLVGLTRILLVGGRRWSSAWLEGRLDRRVTLRAWPQDISPQAEVVESDLAWAELAFLWDSPPLGEELAATVLRRLPRAVRRVSGGSAGAALEAAILELEALDPASLLGG
jgi:hypothetical protein